MQTLKWRLSFNSSRPSRQMKKLWTDANVHSTDDDIDHSKVKVLMVFLDAALSAQEEQAQRVIVDELSDDLVDIFQTLLCWFKLCQLRISDAVHVSSTEDASLLNEAMIKLLAVAEMLVLTKGTKTSLKDQLTTSNPCLRVVLEALHVMENLSCKLAAVRILKAITFTDAHLLELAKLDGFRVLSTVTRKTNEPALTSQVMHLHRQYMEYLQAAKLAQLVGHEALHARGDAISFRNRTYSTSSAGSVSAPGGSTTGLRSFSTSAAQSKMYTISTPSIASGSYSQHQQFAAGMSQGQVLHHHGGAGSSSNFAQPLESDAAEDTSIAAKGLNLAFSFVSELLKFAPITSDWLNGAGRRDKEALLVDGGASAYYEEQLMLAAMLLSSSVLDIETERVRQLERGVDICVTAAHLDNDHSEVKSERSLLYKNTQASTSKVSTRGSVSPSPVDGAFMIDLEAAAVELRTSGIKEPKPASRQSSKEFGYLPPYIDPLDYIRTQIQEQDMLSVLMLGIERAMGPSEALEALLTLQTMLVGDAAAQALFGAVDGYGAVSAMLLRVEENLILLAPCSQSSLAAAAGQAQARKSLSSTSSVSSDSAADVGPQASKTSPPGAEDSPRHRHPASSGEPVGLYGSFAKGEFDSYYSHLVMIVMNFILDDAAVQQINTSNQLPFLPSRGSEIKNVKAMALLIAMLSSSSSGLTTVAVRICFALMKLHAPNVVVLEVGGVVSVIVEVLLAIVFVGRLDIASTATKFVHNDATAAADVELGTASDADATEVNAYKSGAPTGSPSTDSALTKDSRRGEFSLEIMYALASDIILLLQIVAVATANRDNAVVNLLALVVQQASAHTSRGHRRSHYHAQRCQNCEMESACLQCLNDGCINDESSLLCQECDNVFHKSTVKKSHIRIPVLDGGAGGNQPITPSGSQEKLNMSRDNSSSLHNIDGAIAEEESCPRTSTATSYLIAELNEYCKIPLVKHGVLDAASSRLNPLEYGSLPLSRSAHDISANESLLCALLAGIRGIVDDREVRGLDRSTSVFRSLLVSLRSAVSAPVRFGPGSGTESFGYLKEAFTPALSLRLSDLIDHRADVLSSQAADHSHGDNRDHKGAAAEYLQNPPEITHDSSRRVRLSLLVQCIARFVTSRSILHCAPNLFAQRDDHYGEMSALLRQNVELESTVPSKSTAFTQALCLQLLMLYGIDAVLVHLIIDSSAYTQVTTIDRQYLTWMLRETILTATCHKFEHCDRLYRWFSWILRGNVVLKSGQFEGARPRQKLLYKQSAPKTATPLKPSAQPIINSQALVTPRGIRDGLIAQKSSSTALVFAAVPSTSPLIPVLIRVLVLQEMRLLMDTVGGSGLSNIPDDWLEAPGFVGLHEISVASNASGADANTAVIREAERTAVGSNAKRPAAGSVSQPATVSLASMRYHRMFSNKTVRRQLVASGFVETFADLVMGELCAPGIYNLLRPDAALPSRSLSGTGFDFHAKETRLTELEKEEWWCAFAALCALVTGCDDAKDRVQDYIGIDNLIRFLLPLIELQSADSSAIAAADTYRSVFNTLIVELCVKKEQFAAPCHPFTSAVVRFPQQLPDSPTVKHDSATAEQHKLSKLLLRPRNSKGGLNHETGPSKRHSTRASESVDIAALAGVSATFFAHDKTCLLVSHTTKPFPLVLHSERFRRSFSTAGTGAVPAPVPVKHHIQVTSRSSLKGSDAGEIRSRLSIDGDMNLNQGTSTGGGAALMSRRLLLRRNISTASIHSAESDGRWDAESIGMGSSAHGEALGRGSFHSYHSLLALSQALTSQAHTPTASVSGDHLTHTNAFFPSSFPKQSERQGHESTKAGRHIISSVNMEEFPYPPMTNTSDGMVPNVFVPLLHKFEGGQEAFSTNVLVLLHHALLIRAGYSEGIMPADLLESPTKDDDQRCHSRQYSEDPMGNPDLAVGFRMSLMSTDSAHGSAHYAAVEHSVEAYGNLATPSVDCGLVLRRHLALFMVPLVSGGARSWSHRELAYQPAYSRLQLRSPECSELLLAAAVVSSAQSQIFLLSTLSHLLEGNPYNAHAFILKPTTCIGLSRLIPNLSEVSQEKVGYLLSQVLRYSLQQPILRELVDVMKRQRSMSEDWSTLVSSADNEESARKAIGDDANVSDAKSLLFVMGRTAERVGPEAFLHFDQASPFKSRVELPAIQAPVPPIQEISVCAWVRVGALADAPTSSFLQLHSASADLLVNAYFRVVYKLTSQRDKDGHDSGSGHTTPSQVNHNFQGALPQRVTKRVVQLCLSFGKSVVAGKSRYENGLSTSDSAAPGAISAEIAALNSSYASSNPRASTDHPVLEHRRAHWHLAIEQLCDHVGERSASQKIDVDVAGRHAQDLHVAAAALANAVCHFSLPDAIVEFDWSELGDWHLLVLGLSADRLTCSVDGIEYPILHWNPIGYQYDEHSSAIKSATENNMPRLRTLSAAKKVDPAALTQQQFIGQHEIDFGKGFPITVSLGGMAYEQSHHDIVRNHVASAAVEGMSQGELGLVGLLQAFDTTIAGFCGTVGEFVVLSSAVEEAKLLVCLRDGPMGGFRELKSGRLSALTSPALRNLAPPVPAKATSDSTSLTFPSFLSSSSGPTQTPMESVSLNVFSSNYGVGLKERDELFGKARSARDRESTALKFNGDVQIHQTAALVAAFYAIGGIRALYPLLAADKARLVAALRIIGSLISASAEAYQDFRNIEADKVILYCAVQNPRLVTLETLQVMFELVIEAAGPRGRYQNPIVDGGLQLQNCESIHRGVLLELLVDIVVSLPRSSQLARSVIDWLREVCDENIVNCQKVLKSPGLLPVLIMLSSWDIPGCEQLSKAAKAAESKKSAQITAASVVPESSMSAVETQQGKMRRERERSASLGSAPEKPFAAGRSSQIIDISRAAPHPTPALAITTSAEEATSGDNRVRLMDRVNKEFMQKTLNDEQDAAVTHALYTERYKLQLSCSRFLRLLISGTSGEVEHNSTLVLSLLNTVTEFNSQHVATLLSFAVAASSCKQTSLEEGISASLHYARDRERRQRAAHIKRLIYGSFSGIPVLRQVDIATPAYWSYSAALVALDALIDATTSALHAQMISLLKSSFSGTTLQSMMLHLMSSGCVEIRERALRILLLSFSNLDGKLDSKQIVYFDRMHGFQCMAEQLSYHSDGCTEAIIQGLLSLIFWQRNKRRISSSNGSDGGDKRLRTESTVSIASTEDDEGFFPIKPSSPINSRPNSMDMRRHPPAAEPVTPITAAPATVSVEEPKTGPKDAVSPVPNQQAKAAGVDQAPAASSGSLLSLFSWGGSAPTKPAALPTASGEFPAGTLKSADSKATTATATAELAPAELLSCTSTDAADNATPRQSAGEVSSGANEMDAEHRLTSSSKDTAEDKAGRPEKVDTTEKHAHPTVDDTRTSVNHKLYLVDVMEVPQALEALFKVLQNSKSIDQVAGTFKVIEQSVTLTSVTTSQHKELCVATNVLHQRNAESFFAQKDWLVWMCDLLVQFSRQAMNAEDHEGSASVFSLSENESVGVGSYYEGMSGEESEDSNSLAGDYLSEDHNNTPHGHKGGGYKASVGSADSLSGRVTAWQQHLVDQYSSPVYTLVRKLLLQDMISNKPSSSRRWNELFRISMPELNGIQERLLLDLIGCMQNLSEFCEDINSTLNLLKNIAALLEQSLEKADLTLPFCVKVVQALHSLAYNCAPEIRSRIKETTLFEIRKNYVVRCLLDNTQDYYTKVAAISEIASPLQGYISTTDTKPLSDVNVVMMVLGLLVEACEDLEFLLGGVDSSEVMLCESATSTVKGPGIVDDIRFIGSPVPASTSDRVHILFEVLEVLIESVQNCVLSSSECKKCVMKLVSNIPGDTSAHCLVAFLKAFDAKSRQANAASAGSTTTAGDPSISAIDSDHGKASSGNGSLSRSNTYTGASSTAAQSGSYTWWGGWSGTTTSGDGNTAEAAGSSTSKAAEKSDSVAGKASAEKDLEANGTALESTSPASSNMSLQVPASQEERPRVMSLEEAAPAPMNIRSFISWFCSFDQREVQGEFRMRVLAEIRTTQRAADKLREKTVQRYMRHTRQAQEKRQKEKVYASKVAKDALNLTKIASEKVSAKFQKDTKTWVTGLHDKCEAGKTAFNNSFEDRFLGSKSPLKDPKGASQSLPVYNGLLTDRLKGYLKADPLHNGEVGACSTAPVQGSYFAVGVQKSKAQSVDAYDSTAALTDLLSYFQAS